MPVSPEQRQILLERLEMARKAKAEKTDMPKHERKKKEPAVADKIEPTPPLVPFEPHIPAPSVNTQEPRPEEPPHKPNKNTKNKYMKVVFYSEPGKKKVENLLRSLDDDASSDAAPPQKKVKKPMPAAVKKKPAVKKPIEDDSLDQLARLYFS